MAQHSASHNSGTSDHWISCLTFNRNYLGKFHLSYIFEHMYCGAWQFIKYLKSCWNILISLDSS